MAPDLQGRVFAIRALIASVSRPAALLLVGPLADQVLEAAMVPGGALSFTLDWLVGTGPGADMSLMFILAGASGIFVSLAGYAFSTIRNVEDILPDHAEEVTPLARAHGMLLSLE